MSLGEQLKQAREDAGLRIEDLATITKIQSKYLKRLEAEEYDKLPTPVYIRGFIQKWARVCGVDSEKLLLQFYRENKPLINRLEDRNLSYTSKARFSITSKHLIYSFIVLMLVSLGGYLAYHQISFQVTPKLHIASPRDFNSVNEDGNILIEGKADNVEKIFVNDREISSGENGSFEYNYELSSGLNAVVIKAQGSTGVEVETIRKILRP